MGGLIRKVKELYRRVADRYPLLRVLRVNVLVFGNRRPLRRNIQFLTHHWRCRRAYASPNGSALPPAVQQAVQKLRTDGYCIFDPPADLSLTRAIAEKVVKLVQAGETSITSGLEEWMIQVREGIKKIPELPRLLRPEIVQTLEAYFGSHFKVYSTEVYRLTPTDEPMQASGLWHTDDYPPAILKAMVYLTDCDRSTGALRVHPRQSTRRLLLSGFFDRHKAERYRSRLEQDCVAMEGRTGTVILWDSNMVHRGTPPEKNLRDAVAFKFVPSVEPWDKHLARVGEGVCYERRRQIPDDPAAD